MTVRLLVDVRIALHPDRLLSVRAADAYDHIGNYPVRRPQPSIDRVVLHGHVMTILVNELPGWIHCRLALHLFQRQAEQFHGHGIAIKHARVQPVFDQAHLHVLDELVEFFFVLGQRRLHL